jgi:hypothetical protein
MGRTNVNHNPKGGYGIVQEKDGDSDESEDASIKASHLIQIRTLLSANQSGRSSLNSLNTTTICRDAVTLLLVLLDRHRHVPENIRSSRSLFKNTQSSIACESMYPHRPVLFRRSQSSQA